MRIYIWNINIRNLGSEIKHMLLNHIDTSSKNTILEIGCFEGLSSAFFAYNLLIFIGPA